MAEMIAIHCVMKRQTSGNSHERLSRDRDSLFDPQAETIAGFMITKMGLSLNWNAPHELIGRAVDDEGLVMCDAPTANVGRNPDGLP